MHPLLAWLPFLAALLVAFAAGVAFARINTGLTSTSAGIPETPSRRGGIFGPGRADVALPTALVAVMVGTLLVWLFIAIFIVHIV